MILLEENDFQNIYKYVKDNYGINLEKKKSLIQMRLQSTLAERNIDNFADYFKIVKMNRDELTNFLNHITTNHTYFMREKEHFDFLSKVVLPEITEKTGSRNYSIWSAGCSSGEEAFTIAMTVMNYLGLSRNSWFNKIYATDISEKVINKAKNGVYDDEALKMLPPEWKRRFFSLSNTDGLYRLKPEILNQVDFKYLNLMQPLPYKQKFDIIFCRNVMIYFDAKTKLELVNKFYDCLKPGGYFIIGHSETIMVNETKYKYIRPSIYKKE